MTETQMYLVGLAFLVMVLLGYFFTVLVCARGISNKLAWALAPAVGVGICSIVFFLFRRPMFTVECLLLVVLFAAWWRYRKERWGEVRFRDNRIPVLAAWMVGALTWVTLASVIYVHKVPHGEWDAWAIWNSHARYLYRAGPVWQQHIKNTNHPDYPLLLPAATARLWRYMGKDVPEAPGVQGVLIAISGVAVLAATLWELRASSVSFLVPLLLVGTPWYFAVWQHADVPLAVFILSTIALICVHWERDNARLLVMAGFTAGCAAWTKNEGLLFVLATVVLMLLPIFWRPVRTMRRLGMFSLGLLLPLAVTFYFKFAVPSPNDIIHNRAYAELMEKILDIDRYTTIGAAFWTYAGSFGGWAIHPGIALSAFLAVYGVNRRFIRNGGWITGSAVLVFMLAGYFSVFVITALPLQVHLASSLERLLMHLWPALLLLAGLAAAGEWPQKST